MTKAFKAPSNNKDAGLMTSTPQAFRESPDIAVSTREISPAYWFEMFAASALGTNIGDFWVDDIGLGRIASFASLAVVCIVAIAIDRRWGGRTEAGFWTAIVVLRAAATTCADYLTHELGLSYPLVTIVLGLAALALGALTIADPIRRGAPSTDLRFWAAMLVAGLCGTAGGDLASHTIGLGTAALGLGMGLAALIVMRRAVCPSVLMAYWIVLLADRTAATPAGDWLASRLGLPVAMLVTGGLLAAGLTLCKAMGETLRPRG